MEPPLTNGERYVERTCCMCGCKFHDNTPSYCRVCTNQYYAWRQRQLRAGLSTTVTEYRRVTGKVRVPRTKRRAQTLKECPICFSVHVNPYSTYCTQCKSWYQQWAAEQRKLHAETGGRQGRARPTVEEFRCMVFDAPDERQRNKRNR